MEPKLTVVTNESPPEEDFTLNLDAWRKNLPPAAQKWLERQEADDES